MEQQSRQIHLSEMGVSQWHARFVLAGAAESPVITIKSPQNEASPKRLQIPMVAELSKEAEESLLKIKEVDGDRRALINDASSSSAESALDSLALLSGLSIDEDEAVEVKTAPRVVSFKPLKKVSLRAYSSNGYLVVSDVGANVSHLEECSLLQNIIKVVDEQCSKFEFIGEFNWPVFNSPKILVGQECMLESLVSRWLVSFNLTKKCILLCFGQQSKEMVAAILSDSPEFMKGEDAVYFADSLEGLYTVPLRKKDLWNIFLKSADKFNFNSRT